MCKSFVLFDATMILNLLYCSFMSANFSFFSSAVHTSSKVVRTVTWKTVRFIRSHRPCYYLFTVCVNYFLFLCFVENKLLLIILFLYQEKATETQHEFA